MISKLESRNRIHRRIRKKVSGVADKPRLVVFRSNKAIYCQLIDDSQGTTLAAARSSEVKTSGPKIDIAKEVGALIAERAKAIGVNDVKFDRGGYLYHGRVKSLADGAREKGLNF